MAPAPAARGSSAEPARVAPEPRAEPARGAGILHHQGEGLAPQAGNDWVPDWSAIPDLLGGEALPLVMEVYGWLSWTTSGTTRGMRNQRFKAVLLRRDGGNREVPPGGWVAREDHEIRAGWPDRGPEWPALLEGWAVLPVTDREANVWRQGALRTAIGYWRYRPRKPPPPQPEPPHKGRRTRQPAAMVMAQRPAETPAGSLRPRTAGRGGGGSSPAAQGRPPRHARPPQP